MLDEFIILLIFIIITSILIIFYANSSSSSVVLGGVITTSPLLLGMPGPIPMTQTKTNNDQFEIGDLSQRTSIDAFTLDGMTDKPFRHRRIFIPDKETLVIDGHNIIHSYINHKPLSPGLFEKTLIKVSKIIQDSFETQDLHIVVKNPDYYYINKKTNLDSNIKSKKSNGSHIYTFRELIKISKKFPRITFHLAYEKPTKKDKPLHYMRGRDDFLVLYLARDGYIISKDRFRDFKEFGAMKSFEHYQVKNGNVGEKEIIKPINEFKKLNKPSIGNHFIFELCDKETLDELGIKTGQIYLMDTSVFGKVYFEK